MERMSPERQAILTWKDRGLGLLGKTCIASILVNTRLNKFGHNICSSQLTLNDGPNCCGNT